jgi:hypothetical protein
MNGLRPLWRAACIGLTAVAYWLALGVAAFAAPPPQPKPAGSDVPSGGDYVMQYGVVLLCIALGMLFVCRSSQRRDRARPENYEEAKAK